MHQRLAFTQELQHRFVGFAPAVLFQNRLADQFLRHLLFERQFVRVGEAAVVVHRRINRKAVLQAELVVLQTVPWRDMHESGAGGVFHEAVAGKQFSCARAERVLKLDLPEVIGVQATDDFVAVPAAFLRDRRQEQGGNDERFSADARLRVAES